MVSRHRIYWITPATIFGAFLFALCLAIGHHCFYAHLSGQPAPSGDYFIAGATLSKQQANVASGTALAFLFKSALAFAVASSYTQLFWRVLTSSKKATRVADVDAAYSLLGNLLEFCRSSTWTLRYVLLTPVAVIFWLLPLASIFTPATLSVRSELLPIVRSSNTEIPVFNFVNSNFFSSGPTSWADEELRPGNDSIVSYRGSSLITQRIANVVADRGQILAITPPALNSSWQYEFSGPAMQCENVSEPERTHIATNFATMGNAAIYYSWRSFGNVLKDPGPYVNGTLFPLVSSGTGGGDTPSRLYIVGRPEAPDDAIPSTDDEAALLDAVISWFAQNMAMVRCTLYNATYALDFKFLNGLQSITNIKPRQLAEAPMLKGEYFRLGQGNSTRDCPPKERGPRPILSDNCFSRQDAETASYQAIEDAFANILYGDLQEDIDAGVRATVFRTPLVETNELAFLMDSLDNNASLLHTTAFLNREQPDYRRQESLAHTAERLFENITISLLSEPLLQPNKSSPFYSPPNVEVAFERYGTVYRYDAKTLWTAYGVALLVAGLAVLMGTTALWLNGVAYDNTFSTVLRATYIDGPGASRSEALHNRSTDRVDDGSRPLPKALARAIVVVRSSSRNRKTDLELRDSSGAPPQSDDASGVEASLLHTSKRHTL